MDKVDFYHENGYLILDEVDLTEGIDVDNIRNHVASINKERVQDLWMHNDYVRKVACHPYILETLRELYNHNQPFPFQTLNFLTSPQQALHQDYIHFSSDPDPNYMLGVWTAFQNITEDDGPLVYAVGSHKHFYTYQELGIETPTGQLDWNNPQTEKSYREYEQKIADIVWRKGYELKTLTVKKGTALIWAAGLIHGSIPLKPVREGSTRNSQVTHFFFEGMSYTTPMFQSANHKVYRNPFRIN